MINGHRQPLADARQIDVGSVSNGCRMHLNQVELGAGAVVDAVQDGVRVPKIRTRIKKKSGSACGRQAPIHHTVGLCRVAQAAVVLGARCDNRHQIVVGWASDGCRMGVRYPP